MTSSSTPHPAGGAVEAGANKPQVSGEHYWIGKAKLPGIVLCKWCGLTRSPAAKARRCEPMPAARALNPTSKE